MSISITSFHPCPVSLSQHGNVSFSAPQENACIPLLLTPHSDIGRTHLYMRRGTHFPLWRYNKPTRIASFTNGKHLYSTATWPLVIAAAFFVPVILRYLGPPQHDAAPTSPRRSVTVKGHTLTRKNKKNILKSQTLQTQRRDLPVAADESDYTKRGESFSKRK